MLTHIYSYANATLLPHGGPGVLHGLPGAGDVQEDGVRHPAHPEAVFAHVLVPDGDQVVHAVLPELLRHRLRPLLVELHRVQVTRGGDGAQDGVGERAAARACNANGGMRTARAPRRKRTPTIVISVESEVSEVVELTHPG